MDAKNCGLLMADYAECLVDTLVKTGAHRATKYISEKLVIRVTRRKYKAYKGKRQGFPPDLFEVQITCSRPNYTERDFIKAAKKAREPFPIVKTQLQY